MKTYNWGILGCGGIAGKFATGLSVLDRAVRKGAASRSLEKAQKFCSENHVEKAYGSYEDMVRDPQIDIVYIATPHMFHYENALLCLEHGKHVLCEKSFTLNARQAQHLADVATERNLFLMEAMWTRFLPANVEVCRLLNEGKIGTVGMVHAGLGFPAEFNPEGRLFNKALAGGAILDVGVYPISYADMVFGTMPQQITGQAFIGETDVDNSSSYLLDYGEGKFAVLSSSLRNNLKDEAIISGSEGYIRIPFFHHPHEFYIHRNDYTEENRMDMPFESTGYNYEAQHVMECLDAGKRQSDVMPLGDTIRVMQIMDELRSQWNFTYDGE